MAGKSSSDIVYKVWNPYSSDERDIFYISDVPHLVKTVRNAWSNSFGHNQARALWVRTAYVLYIHLYLHVHTNACCDFFIKYNTRYACCDIFIKCNTCCHTFHILLKNF